MTRTTRARAARRLLAAAAALALTAGATALSGQAAAASVPRSTLVVVLDDDERRPADVGREIARQHGGELGFVYQHALKGFSVTVPDRAAAAIARDRRVVSVERDQVFTTTSQATPTGITRTYAGPTEAGNDLIDIDSTDDSRVDVDIAVIDTGLDSDHPDLNISGGTDCTGGSPLRGTCTDGAFEDGNGHGTHVGGSAAAIDNGIGVVGMAPGARLHGVKVLSDSGSGYTSWIIAGIDWVTARADDIEVANMSLGCECSSSAQDTAIANSVAAGVTYVVAAGNSDKDSSTFSPANHQDVITVSALADFDGKAGGLGSQTCRTDRDDTLADFSNFGPGVEIAAPGVCITSTWPGGGYDTISGTSMASPHVAGTVGLLASSDATALPAELESRLVTAGNTEWTDDSGDGITEPLLDVSDTTVFTPTFVSGDGGGGTPPPSTETIALTATGYKVKGVQHADLAWSETTSTGVDVYRDASKIATTADDGAYTDAIGSKGGGTYTYQVCAAGTTTCSSKATVVF